MLFRFLLYLTLVECIQQVLSTSTKQQGRSKFIFSFIAWTEQLGHLPFLVLDWKLYWVQIATWDAKHRKTRELCAGKHAWIYEGRKVASCPAVWAWWWAGQLLKVHRGSWLAVELWGSEWGLCCACLIGWLVCLLGLLLVAGLLAGWLVGYVCC